MKLCVGRINSRDEANRVENFIERPIANGVREPEQVQFRD